MKESLAQVEKEAQECMRWWKNQRSSAGAWRTLEGEQGKQTGKGSWAGSAGGLINQGKSHVWRVVICNQGYPVRSRLISSLNAGRTREGRNDECERLETGTSASRWNRWDFLVGQLVKNPPANAGDSRDVGLIPGLGGSLGEGNGNSLRCSCLENSMDGRAWQATVHGVTKNQTQLNIHTHQMRAGENFEKKNISKDFK